MNTKTAIKNVANVPNKFDKTGGTVTGAITKTGSGAGFIVSHSQNSRTMVYASTTGGEHLFGGNNNGTSEVTDYLRVGANKLQYTTNKNNYDVYHSGNKPTPAAIGAAPTHDHPYIPTSASCNKNWRWDWGTQAPTHLWGSQGSSTDFYVYKPSDLSVNYANSAGSAANASKINGKNVFIQTSQPSGPSTGDIWISW